MKEVALGYAKMNCCWGSDYRSFRCLKGKAFTKTNQILAHQLHCLSVVFHSTKNLQNNQQRQSNLRRIEIHIGL
jgi:hypothetical protein